MLKKGSIKFFVATLLALIPVIANAIVITLEPDDYGLGVPLENSYVTTAFLDGSMDGDPWGSALTAQDRRVHDPQYKAPTGRLIFGNFPLILPSPDLGFGYFGMGIKFHQEVFRVTLLANSLYIPSDLAAVWMAFDNDGNQIAFGGAGGDRPFYETFEINIEVKGIRSLIIGGDASTSAICFDHLRFEFDELPDASVPEPNSLILLLMGLMVMVLRSRSRR